MYLEKYRLDGRIAVVTGGASGIGLACSQALLEAGARVVVADASEANLRRARAQIRGGDEGRVEFAPLDVTQAAAVDAFARACRERHGKVDILVNCAGIGRQSSGEETDEDEWRLVLDVNLNGTFWCAKAFGAVMLAQGGGAIVNIGSMSGDIVTRPQKNVHYNVSKAGVHHMTRSLAAEWADRNVRVNAVAPGFVETPMSAYALKTDVETTRTWLSNTPSGRVGQPDEVASIVHFLASDASSLMTGAIVAADGGYTLW
ncbi:SDR family NAD(P)-dependent oxidoreductase [Paraburkholderia susongensis]|uniref:NAD(P)-dependent dehydrogenase, short-chain alcohol dehydrogenase family n=1 Tax=Paraburkholderia susongensis TaxID=1515439 RepID=A0A1X7M2W1_9BURK|nr:SDR family oxidoreductase [Paraburkholderia susongensis]SMG60516.1 NAD(P)-dependent dehydrogenase, short-chain alcohol dehydrogenase family [Paraburkholderia susongensis]